MMRVLLVMLVLSVPAAYANRDPVECHEAAMNRANASGADITAVFSLMNQGTEHLALLAKCGKNECRLDRIAHACAYYCEAVGNFAALIDNDRMSALYGDLYWSFVDVTTHCDSAESMARSGAWSEVPFFVELMQQAAVEIEAWAIDHE